MNQFFSISRINAVRAEEIAVAPDEPHVHDLEELIVGVKGVLEHFVDFRITTLEAFWADTEVTLMEIPMNI